MKNMSASDLFASRDDTFLERGYEEASQKTEQSISALSKKALLDIPAIIGTLVLIKIVLQLFHRLM
jgi:hypothetical protein